MRKLYVSDSDTSVSSDEMPAGKSRKSQHYEMPAGKSRKRPAYSSSDMSSDDSDMFSDDSDKSRDDYKRHKSRDDYKPHKYRGDSDKSRDDYKPHKSRDYKPHKSRDYKPHKSRDDSDMSSDDYKRHKSRDDKYVAKRHKSRDDGTLGLAAVLAAHKQELAALFDQYASAPEADGVIELLAMVRDSRAIRYLGQRFGPIRPADEACIAHLINVVARDVPYDERQRLGDDKKVTFLNGAADAIDLLLVAIKRPAANLDQRARIVPNLRKLFDDHSARPVAARVLHVITQIVEQLVDFLSSRNAAALVHIYLSIPEEGQQDIRRLLVFVSAFLRVLCRPTADSIDAARRAFAALPEDMHADLSRNIGDILGELPAPSPTPASASASASAPAYTRAPPAQLSDAAVRLEGDPVVSRLWGFIGHTVPDKVYGEYRRLAADVRKYVAGILVGRLVDDLQGLLHAWCYLPMSAERPGQPALFSHILSALLRLCSARRRAASAAAAAAAAAAVNATNATNAAGDKPGEHGDEDPPAEAVMAIHARVHMPYDLSADVESVLHVVKHRQSACLARDIMVIAGDLLHAFRHNVSDVSDVLGGAPKAGRRGAPNAGQRGVRGARGAPNAGQRGAYNVGKANMPNMGNRGAYNVGKVSAPATDSRVCDVSQYVPNSAERVRDYATIIVNTVIMINQLMAPYAALKEFADNMLTYTRNMITDYRRIAMSVHDRAIAAAIAHLAGGTVSAGAVSAMGLVESSSLFNHLIGASMYGRMAGRLFAYLPAGYVLPAVPDDGMPDLPPQKMLVQYSLPLIRKVYAQHERLGEHLPAVAALYVNLRYCAGQCLPSIYTYAGDSVKRDMEVLLDKCVESGHAAAAVAATPAGPAMVSASDPVVKLAEDTATLQLASNAVAAARNAAQDAAASIAADKAAVAAHEHNHNHGHEHNHGHTPDGPPENHNHTHGHEHEHKHGHEHAHKHEHEHESEGPPDKHRPKGPPPMYA